MSFHFFVKALLLSLTMLFQGVAYSEIILVKSIDQFKELIKDDSADQVAILFTASPQKCKPCQIFERKFKRMSEDMSYVQFAEVNQDHFKDFEKLSKEMQFEEVPTIILFKNGEIISLKTGNQSIDAINDIFRSFSAQSNPLN